MDSIIVDLDGTLADCNHRLHFIEQPKKDWKSFFNHGNEDSVIEPVRELINMLKTKYMIIILTARPDISKEATVKWLDDNNIEYDALFMRGKNDYRKSPVVKSDLIEEMKCHDYIPIYAIEDRDDCIDMFNSLGIFTLKVYNSVPV
jgi:hypothetical protein